MVNRFSCVNIFTKKPKEIIAFYHEILEVPVLDTLDDETDGVGLGFIPGAPKLCVWDTNKWGSPVEVNLSLVFMCDNLDQTCEELKQKGLSFDPPVRYDWGVYELRLRDPDGNEVVVAETF